MDCRKCEKLYANGGDCNGCLIEHTGSKSASSDGLGATTFKEKSIQAFINGYEEGTEDAIDGATKDAKDRANDWWDKQTEGGP